MRTGGTHSEDAEEEKSKRYEEERTVAEIKAGEYLRQSTRPPAWNVTGGHRARQHRRPFSGGSRRGDSCSIVASPGNFYPRTLKLCTAYGDQNMGRQHCHLRLNKLTLKFVFYEMLPSNRGEVPGLCSRPFGSHTSQTTSRTLCPAGGGGTGWGGTARCTSELAERASRPRRSVNMPPQSYFFLHP